MTLRKKRLDIQESFVDYKKVKSKLSKYFNNKDNHDKKSVKFNDNIKK
jgi:hypothetical protein